MASFRLCIYSRGVTRLSISSNPAFPFPHVKRMPMVKFCMDRLSPAERSRQMSLVRSKNTKPELLVRKLLFSLGYRYRLHGATLPGRPDLVFAKRRKVIFVHGCFWHRHEGCRKTTTPVSNADYWIPKFARTISRDETNLVALQSLGWRVLVVWECELKDLSALGSKLEAFLDD
jgi:DNA mismatch endonuclease (patch repair protein)